MELPFYRTINWAFLSLSGAHCIWLFPAHHVVCCANGNRTGKPPSGPCGSTKFFYEKKDIADSYASIRVESLLKKFAMKESRAAGHPPAVLLISYSDSRIPSALGGQHDQQQSQHQQDQRTDDLAPLAHHQAGAQIIAQHVVGSSSPAARWMQPSTPPPPKRDSFAALTMASTAIFVISLRIISRGIVDSPIPICCTLLLCKNALPGGRAFDLCSHAAKAYSNTDSVVYNDSILRQKWQENGKATRFYVLCSLLISTRSTPYRYRRPAEWTALPALSW